MNIKTILLAFALMFTLTANANTSVNALNPDVSSKTESKLIQLFDCETGEHANIPGMDIDTLDDTQLAAYGFCQLRQHTNGTYYCSQGSCAGSCVLNSGFASCSCK